MRRIQLASALIGCLLLSGAGAGQGADLRKMSRDLLSSSAASRDSAQTFARSKGWLVRGRTQRGRLVELQGFERGFPFYYGTLNLDAARTTRTDSVQHYVGGGAGFTIGLWDGDAPRMTHQEISPRVAWGDVATAISDDHATHVAGTMIASGVRPQAKGMSPEAAIRAYQWDDDVAEMAAEAAGGLLISNHSYGLVRGWTDLGEWYWFGDTAISETEDYLFGFYSEGDRKLDELACAAPNYLIVIAAGNERNDAVAPGTPHHYYDSRTGTWPWSTKVRDNDGAPLGYDCIANGMAIAKNVLTVGAVEDVLDYGGPDSVRMASFSSWGPTDDGRIKPDICGNGWEVYSGISTSDTSYEYYYGTSMASPNVCGSLALIQDYYRDHHYNLPLKAATLKALAIHTAREAGSAPGPDYGFGWGLLDAYAAYRLITLDLEDRLGLIEEFTLADGIPIDLYYECDGTASELRATISWTDPPGTPAAPALDPGDPMLVNDLDLRASKDAEIFAPWALDPANPAAAASRGDNSRDNVEQVVIESPAAGTYVLRIAHKGSLQGGSQDFSLVVSGAARTNTWHVYSDGSGDAPTITAAVDSASAGDQIFVYQGEYREHDIVVGKQITIKGIRGAAHTRVNAGGLGRCFVLPAGAGPLRIESLTLKNGRVAGVGVDGFGGAILCGNAEAEIVACTITQSAAVRGGGVYVDGSAPLLKNCDIFGNAAEEHGGGVFVSGGGATIDRCVLARNTAVAHGGGIYCDDASPAITSCTVGHNAASGHGGGLYFTEGCEAGVSYSIVSSSLVGEGIYEEGTSGGVAVECCDVFGNTGGDFGGALSGAEGGNGNIALDPQFCDFMAFDYAIGDGSPCAPGENPCGALLGALSPGCHSKTLWLVKADGTGDAPTIQAAVDRAFEGDTIMLAAGTFSGGGNRDITFGGKNLVITSASGPDSTIVECGDPYGSIHWGFYLYSGEDSTSVIEGITIAHASIGGVRLFASSPVIRGCVIDSCITSGDGRGGAVYVDGGSPSIVSCTLVNNRVDTNGGGIFCRESDVLVERCTIAGNTAAKMGGGIAVGTGAAVDVVGCTVSGNVATAETGGGIYVVAGTARIDSCLVSGNAGSFGAGVYNGANAVCSVANSTICGNAARSGGGGAYSSANMTMTNCTVVGNSAVYYGGGLEILNGTQNTVARSIVAFNESGAGIYTIMNVLAISCSDVFGNAGGNYAGSTPDRTGVNYNFSADPAFCDSASSDYRLYDTSSCAAGASPCGGLVGALPVGCRIAPNLVVSSVAWSPAAAAAHDSVAVAVTVRNDGVADADSFFVDFHANLAQAPGAGAVGNQRLLVTSLAVGDSLIWNLEPFTSDTIGAWACWVAVDADGRVVETDESDNASGPYAVVWGIPAQHGWPVAMGGGSQSSPLLVDLDDDAATLEVVVGCWDGNLYVWSSAGEALPGWPVSFGGTTTSPAAGDIAGDSRKEIVVMNGSDGTVRAFDLSGAALWQAEVPTYSAATPVLADLDGDGKLEILVAADNAIYLFEGNGSLFSPSLIGFPDGADARSPAVGDVDGDGNVEIAIVATSVADPGRSNVYLSRANGIPYPGDWPVQADTLVSADPVIGDVTPTHDDMEIVAVGLNGTVYVWDAEGLPVLDYLPSRVPATVEASPVLANLDRDGYHDIVIVSQQAWNLGDKRWRGEGYLSLITGEGRTISTEKIADWETDGGPGLIASAIVIGDPPVAITAAPDTAIHSEAFGFPLRIGGFWSVTPAAGDIDGDGWVELVATGGSSVYCFELCSAAFPGDALWWPLLRRDAARTACYGYEPLAGVDGEDDPELPSFTSLRAIYPNPFNPATRIAFDVAARSLVRIAMYDVSGREVALLVNREMEPGRYEVTWKGITNAGRAAASGMYFCRLTAGRTIETKKAVLIR